MNPSGTCDWSRSISYRGFYDGAGTILPHDVRALAVVLPVVAGRAHVVNRRGDEFAAR